MIEWVYIWETPGPYGWAAIFGGKRGAVQFEFGFKNRNECMKRARITGGESLKEAVARGHIAEHPGPSSGPAWLFPSVVALSRYFNGEKVSFDMPLDWSERTAFQKSVWRAAMKIPYGDTRSYAWVAGKAGSPAATRAAGSALGANPLPIIVPCHRVLRTDGSLGGYALGLNVKQQLLAMEQGKPEEDD